MNTLYKKIKLKTINFYFKKYLDKLIDCIIAFLIFPVLVFMRLIKSKFLFRFVYIPSERFGNFVITAEFYFCELNCDYIKPKQKYIDLFFFGNYVSNEYFAKITKRKLKYIIPYKVGKILYKISSIMKWDELTDLGKFGYYSNRDLLGVFEKIDIQLKLSEEENNLGKKILERDFGIKDGDSFVCINVRDNAYDGSKEDDFRNSSLEKFETTILELVSRGYFVIRMGKKVNYKLQMNHPRVIDYATNGLWSEFMDIYLATKCYFAISTGTGWDSLPMIYRRPILYVNLAQASHITSYYKQSITLFKNFYCQNKKRYMSLSEICNSKIFQSVKGSTFLENNIICEENSEKEILDACIDMIEFLEGRKLTSKEEELNKKFWEIYPKNCVSNYTGIPLHGNICGKYSISYLKNNPDWLS